MKKIFSMLLLLFVLILSACGDGKPEEKEVDSGNVENAEEVESKPTQAELDEKLKEEAIEYSFVELNGDKVDTNEKVKISGEVSMIIKDGMLGEFMLTSQENDGFGMYTIINVLGEELSEGDEVVIYGVYEGKDESGMPKISSTVIEVE